MLKSLVAWFGTSKQVAEAFHQYEFELQENRLVIMGQRQIILAYEADMRAQADELREARLLMRQMRLDLESAAPGR